MEPPIHYVRPTPLNTKGVICKNVPLSLNKPIQLSKFSAFRPFSKEKKSIRVN